MEMRTEKTKQNVTKKSLFVKQIINIIIVITSSMIEMWSFTHDLAKNNTINV